MKKSEFIGQLYTEHKNTQLDHCDVDFGIELILDSIANALSLGERIEVRGFGSFRLHHRKARIGRNPKTGSTVHVPNKHAINFRPSQELRQRVDNLS